MKTMNTFLVAVVVNFLAAGVSLAQNNDAPAPLSSWF
jgi:CHASE3 domain sensor protein